jgi:hypothetical protein
MPVPWLLNHQSGCAHLKLSHPMPVQQPTVEEIEAQLSGRALTAVVFFLDETFEEIAWDMSTTVVDAKMQLAGLIKLTNYETFTLFESRKVSSRARLPGGQDSPVCNCVSDALVHCDRSSGIGPCRFQARARMGSQQDLWRRRSCWMITGADSVSS